MENKNRTIKEQIMMCRDYSKMMPFNCTITSQGLDDLFFFARQMNCEPDEALDLLLGYLSLTDNCEKVLEDLGYKFDPQKVM